jgi:hypothetical protein
VNPKPQDIVGTHTKPGSGIKICLGIFIVAEDVDGTNTALGNVVGITWNNESCEACHMTRLATVVRAVN